MIFSVVLAGWSLADLAIAFIVFLAIIALVVIFIRVTQIPVPQWVWQVVGVVIAALVIIAAIRLLASM